MPRHPRWVPGPTVLSFSDGCLGHICTAVVTAHGRFGVDAVTTATGAVFELRVDDLAPTTGKARPTVRQDELGLFTPVQDSATGVFGPLSAGSHTVSVWVRGGAFGSGCGAMIDPGCFFTDHVYVELYEGEPTQAFAVDWMTLPAFTLTPSKLADIATFSVSSADSIIELTYNGRAAVGNYDTGSTAAVFEIRVDDQLSPMGWASAQIMSSETSDNGRPISITGIFPHLAPGTHTASVWVYGTWGGGSDAQINPQGWHDQLLVTEHEHVRAHVFNVPFTFGVDFLEDTPTKVRDLGTFDVLGQGSLAELIFNGRLGADTITGTGAIFELRIDDQAPNIGRSKATARSSEAGLFWSHTPAGMTAFFDGLAPGSHTASLWVSGIHGDGTRAACNNGGWETDHLVVFEHGDGWLFADDFESGGSAAWSATSP